MRTWTSWVCAVALAAAAVCLAPAAFAETPEQLDARLIDSIGRATEAAIEHADAVLGDGNLAGAQAILDDAIAKAEATAAVAEQTDTRGLLGKFEKSVRKKIAAFIKKLEKARRKLADPRQKPLAINKAIGKSVTTGLKSVALIRKRFPTPGISLMEKNARTAGFHGSGALVKFKTFPGLDPDDPDLPCTEVPQISVVATPPGALSSWDYNGPPGNKLNVVLGGERGLVSVNITACGETRRWLLYNSGEKGGLKHPPVALAGTWQGSYKTTGPPLCSGFGGGWTATFQVDAAGNVTGDWNGDGFSGTISGKLQGDEATFTIRGDGDVSLKGRITGNSVDGSFTGEECTPASGNIKGTFQGARTQ